MEVDGKVGLVGSGVFAWLKRHVAWRLGTGVLVNCQLFSVTIMAAVVNYCYVYRRGTGL
jgi:hypothetical protein